MALTTRTLPALMNGISRQPAILRSPDQTEDEVNTWGDIARGVGRRPPTRNIQQLSIALGDATVHHINRDINERYTVIIDEGSILVFDETTGEQKTVTAPLGYGYLDAAGPDYRAVTIADYTFIVNTQKVVKMKAAGADEVDQDPNLIAPGGSSPTELNADLDAPSLYAGKLYQYKPNPSSAGGLTGTVKTMDDLPDPPAGTYAVVGSTDTAFVSFYVRGDGTVWNETVKPGLVNALDELTMPHALIREGDGTFKFVPFTWKPRRVGDLASNPAPPFVERTIRDVFFYQNRLAFLADESVIFSTAGDYGDFWRRTVLDYIDSDALAASAATTDVAILDFAVPFADGVMLFSKQRQLALSNADSGLSAHSLAISPVTNYIMSPAVKPTPMGSQVHFVTSSSGRTSVQEYTRLTGANPTEAADITAHVPDLLPEGATQIIPAHDLSALFVITNDAPEADRSKMYAYQFFWDGDKKLQSAWRVWDFGDGKPVSGAYESGSLHLLMDRGGGFYLERIDLSPQAVSENQDRTIFLDRQEAVTGVYDAVRNQTSFTASFPLDPAAVRIVRGSGSAAVESVISPATYSVSGSTVTVPGNEAGAAATMGHAYETRLTLSEQFPTDWQGRPLTTGRLVLHTFTVNVSDSGYTRAEVYPYGEFANELNGGLKHTSEQSFTGQYVGKTIIGEQTYYTGAWSFSVAGSSKEVRIDLINDSPFASTWTSAEWEGLFFSRAF